jgi:hypothetical protein
MLTRRSFNTLLAAAASSPVAPMVTKAQTMTLLGRRFGNSCGRCQERKTVRNFA